MSSPITTHVLDTSLGRPAAGVFALLEFAESPGAFKKVGEGTTDADGRIRTLLASGALKKGDYRLTFSVAAYFSQLQQESFYKSIPLEFHIARTDQHFHVPLLLSPFGYATYRGS